MPVFQAFDAGFHGPADTARRIQVGQHIASVIRSGFDNGLHLLRGELQGFHGVAVGTHAAAGHDLNLGGTEPELFPDGPAAFSHPVAQDTAQGIPVLDIPVAMSPGIIPVTAGLGKVVHTGINARAGNDPFVNGLLQAVRHAARVADGGDAMIQELSGNHGSDNGIIAGRGTVHVHLSQVHMGVRQAGYGIQAFTVNDPVKAFFGESARKDVRDQPILDHNIPAFQKVRVLSVKNMDILNDRSHVVPLHCPV